MTTPGQALAQACAQTGLDDRGARILYARSNTVYKLATAPVVVRLRYAPGSQEWFRRLSVSVRVTAWLREQSFPSVKPLDIRQPVRAGGYLVTFWHYLPEPEPGREEPETLGRLLRDLHALPAPPAELPPARPLSSLPEDAARCEWLSEQERTWLLGRAEELGREYARTAWTLGSGLIHCDAWAENLIWYRGGVVLADWDSVSYGPREQDLAPAALRQRFGRPISEWHRFCTAYGVDPGHLPGLSVLRQMRELRTLVPYVRGPGQPRVQAEVRRRIADIRSGDQREPWEALNLVR